MQRVDMGDREKLGIGSTMLWSVRALAHQRAWLAPLVLCWLVAEAVFGIAHRTFTLHLRGAAADLLAPSVPWMSSWDWPYLFHAVAAIPHNLFGSVFAVLVMRTFLYAHPLGSVGNRSSFAWSVAALFLFKMCVSAYHVTWQWAAYPHAGMIPTLFVWAFFWTIGTAVLARFCLVYAAASMGRGWQLQESWRAAAGNGFRLIFFFLAVYGAARVVGNVAEGLITAQASDLGRDAILVALACLGAVKKVATSMILLAVISVAFSRLTGYPAAGIPYSQRTREALAATFD